MKCEICNQGPPEGPAIYRVNQPGEMPARWRCLAHLTEEQRTKIDPVVKDIVEVCESNRPVQEIVKKLQEFKKTL